MVSVRLETDAKVWRGTGDEPTATVDIWSIGVFDEVKNEKYVPHFYQYFAKTLNIKEERYNSVIFNLHNLKLFFVPQDHPYFPPN